MDDMKDKVKGFMKRVNNSISSSSSSSSSFKGQGRVLGSSSSGSNNSFSSRPSQIPNSNPKPNNPPSDSSKSSNPSISNSISTSQNRSELSHKSNQYRKPADGFDPFDSFITSGKRSGNGYSLNVFECPICGQNYRSEEEVSVHVDSCVNSSAKIATEFESKDVKSPSELEICVSNFLSGKPSLGSLEVVLKLLKNIVREPENSKFRKIRMSNPKIKEAISEVGGGVELLEFVGFKLQEEDGEMWAAMEIPTEENINVLCKVIDVIAQPTKLQEQQENDDTSNLISTQVDQLIQPKKVDRQIRVFFAVPENVAAKIELPDSFYKLSIEEVKREAMMRKQKIAESQLLIPKSYKEKQAQASRRKYTRTVIRIQFPDGVVLQAVFSPWESTSVLYEFVSSSLKEPGLEFELVYPFGVKWRVVSRFCSEGEKVKTVDDEELVPSALIKFRPIETDSVVFTGLRNDLLEIIEPLVSGSAVAPPLV